MNISKDKKYKTRQGNQAVVYAIYEGQEYGVLGAYKDENGLWFSMNWDIEGRHSGELKTLIDLVEVDPLEEARERYPDGTVFICAYDGERVEVEVDDQKQTYWIGYDSGNILTYVSGKRSAYIKFEGKWADIVSKPSEITKEQVIEYLKNNL